MIFNMSTGGASTADKVKYNNTESGLQSTDVQGAIDEVNISLGNISNVGNATYNSVEKLLKLYIEKGYLPDINNIPLIPEMTSNTTPSGIASASSEVTADKDTYYAYMAFDKNTTNSEACWMANSASGSWLQYQFPNAVTVQKIEITNRYRSDNANIYAPKEFIVQGSNNGSDWNNLGTFTNYKTDSAVKHTYSFANNSAYSYYRLYFNSGHNTSKMAIGELQMYTGV